MISAGPLCAPRCAAGDSCSTATTSRESGRAHRQKRHFLQSESRSSPARSSAVHVQSYWWVIECTPPSHELAHFRQLNISGASFYKFAPQFFLKNWKLVRKRELSNIKPFGCSDGLVFFSDCHEVFQLPQFHALGSFLSVLGVVDALLELFLHSVGRRIQSHCHLTQ